MPSPKVTLTTAAGEGEGGSHSSGHTATRGVQAQGQELRGLSCDFLILTAPWGVADAVPARLRE